MTVETDLTLAAHLVGSERSELINLLRLASPTDPTLCEGWESRHMVAHLILRETSPLTAAGVVGGPLAERTDRETNAFADRLLERVAYDDALHRFAHLSGYLRMRQHLPAVDCSMNLIEYFVHIEDLRRAQPGWESRNLAPEIQQKMWDIFLRRARLMVGSRYRGGLVLEAPGFLPRVHTVVKPPEGSVAQVLTGEPGELVLYLFGRESVAKIKSS